MATQEQIARGEVKRHVAKDKSKRQAARRRLRGSQKPAKWADAPADALHSVVVSVTEAGGYISFSKTRDGGALYVVIYFNGDKYEDYFRPSDDYGTLLRNIAEDFKRVDEVQLELPL